MKRLLNSMIATAALAVVAACSSDETVTGGIVTTGDASVRVVNGYNTPVSVSVDGQVAVASVAAGEIATAAAPHGAHSIKVQPLSGGSASAPQSVTLAAGGRSSIAAVRSASGAVATMALDDTNSVVAAGKTKVRVLHLAPNAGTLQVYRTQPDYQTPIAWQFPFNYQAEFNSLSAPFYESTVGTWEIRVWQTPASASGWESASVRVTIPLGSGEKKTVVLLDKPGGGVRFELL
jgi:hypothetical protein